VHNLNDSSKNSNKEIDYTVNLNLHTLSENKDINRIENDSKKGVYMPEDDYPMDADIYLEDDLNYNDLLLKPKKPLKVHQDVGSKLDYCYDDRGLTAISEEQSRQNTEFNFETGKVTEKNFHSKGFLNSKNSNLESLSKTPGNLDSAKKNVLGKSIEDLVSLQKMQNGKLKSKGRLTKSVSVNFKSRNKLNIDSEIMKKKKFSSDFKTVVVGSPLLKRKTGKDKTSKNLFFNEKNDENKKKSENRSTQDSLTNFDSAKKKIFFNQVQKPNLFITNEDTLSFTSLLNLANSIENRESKNIIFPKVPKPEKYIINLFKDFRKKPMLNKNETIVQCSLFKVQDDLFYKGGIKFGKLNGQGVLYVLPENETDINYEDDNLELDEYVLFQGEFKNNQVEGKGKLNFAFGYFFEGSFKCGKAHGYGKLFDEKDQIVVEGIWLDGIYNQ
jgi:hypothetical protein